MTAESTLERTVTIRADRDLVFRFFTDSAKWASWWGAGSTIDPRVGGKMLIVYPGGTQAAGEVTEIHPTDRIAFTYGYVKGKPIGVGESQVTIRLSDVREGTRVQLTHVFADAAVAREHVQGWRYQLSLFSNAVANEKHARAADAVDGWFAMWSNPVDAERWQQLDRLAASGIVMRDKFTALEGLDDIRAHIDGVHRFMPGVTLKRDGDVKHCQGEVLVNWTGVGKDGKLISTGANVFTLAADGRIAAVTGFWG